MKATKITALALALMVLGSLAGESAYARGGRGRVTLGFHFGVPLGYYPYYYPPPYYYYPPSVVVAPSAPPTYIERPAAPAAPEPQAWWYYCADAGAYYPYVKHCPGGWQRVAPQPPD